MSDEASSSHMRKRRAASSGKALIAALRKDYALLCREWARVTLNREKAQTQAKGYSLSELQSALLADTDKAIHTLTRIAARLRRFKSTAKKRERPNQRTEDDQEALQKDKHEIELFRKLLQGRSSSDHNPTQKSKDA